MGLKAANMLPTLKIPSFQLMEKLPNGAETAKAEDPDRYCSGKANDVLF